MQLHELTGKLETVTVDNMCKKYRKKCMEHVLIEFVLQELANTDECPIKKGAVKISYPLDFEFQIKDPKTPCGPIIAMFSIIKKNQSNSDNNSLLMNIWFRGVITGDSCE
ncbi:uncharacterized protein LOC122505595 [Leptopilina heterotoma]|uniref:uncharacterized protein LOC122505595 n=1 Tax=Leptopilina heterotoma TaxID=63436 RepID=UPI001CA8EC35|nr:uncharacterized protein LOC122505595 [Leptopilina heterotoma]